MELGVPDDEFRRRRSSVLKAQIEADQERLVKASGSGKGRRYPPGHLEAVAEIVRDAQHGKSPLKRL